MLSFNPFKVILALLALLEGIRTFLEIYSILRINLNAIRIEEFLSVARKPFANRSCEQLRLTRTPDVNL